LERQTDGHGTVSFHYYPHMLYAKLARAQEPSRLGSPHGINIRSAGGLATGIAALTTLSPHEVPDGDERSGVCGCEAVFLSASTFPPWRRISMCPDSNLPSPSR
jgi:hypothetical protein